MSSGLDDLTVLSRRALGAALRREGTETLYAADATAGNGHDTLFLADAVGPNGKVWAFDVQEAALRSTLTRLRKAGLAERVHLLHAGHEHMASAIPAELRRRLRALTFNLGFLPGGDRALVTQPESTLCALDAALIYLAPCGVLSVHCYHGHQGGAEEGHAVAEYFSALLWQEWRVAHYEFVNKQRNREELFLVERG